MGPGSSWMAIVLALAGAALLVRHLSLRPAEIEARARHLRGGLVEYYHRRKTKRELAMLAIIGILMLIWMPSIPRIVFYSFGFYALIVVFQMLFRPSYPAIHGGLALPPEPPGEKTQPATPTAAAAPAPVQAPARPPVRPAPQPSPGLAPRPVMPPRMARTADRPATSVGSVLGAVAVLAAVFGIGAALMMTHSEFEASATMDAESGSFTAGRAIPDVPQRLRRVSRVSINNKAVVVGARSDARVDQKPVHVVRLPKDLSDFDVKDYLGKAVEIESECHDEAKTCEMEVMKSVVDLLPMALRQVSNDDSEEISAWKPGRDSLDEVLTGFTNVDNVKAAEGGPAKKRAKIILDMSADKLKRVYDRFLNTRRDERSYRLARAYAGAVLLLGGVAVFMRIGTGRKPTLP